MRKSQSTPSDRRPVVTTLAARPVRAAVDWLMLGGLVGLAAWMAGTLWR